MKKGLTQVDVVDGGADEGRGKGDPLPLFPAIGEAATGGAFWLDSSKNEIMGAGPAAAGESEWRC